MKNVHNVASWSKKIKPKATIEFGGYYLTSATYFFLLMVVSKEQDLLDDNKWIQNNLGRYLEPGKKRELILRWASNLEQLHTIGKFEQPITTISSYITDYLKENNLGRETSYAREVLPFKYKQMEMNRSDTFDFSGAEESSDTSVAKDSSTLLAEDCKKINANYITRLERTIKWLGELKKCLESDTILEAEIPEQELEEYFVRWDAALARIQEVMDGRQQVLPSTQHMLFYALSQATLNHAYSNYVRFMRDFASITAKQSGKILRGHVTKMLLLYEPKNQDEAIFNGFYGTICQRCEGFDTPSWRVQFKYNSDASKFMLYCYRCGKWHEAKTEALMK